MDSPPTSASTAPPRFDRANQCLRWGARRVDLSANAFRMLEFLVDHPGRLLGKDELLDAVWPDAHVVDAVLSVTVSQLREALDDDPRRPRFIETVHRRGYRWIGTVAGDEAAPEAEADGSQELFVGRAEAVAQLEAAARLAAQGRRQVVFVTGEPGIGKTMLVDRFLASPALAGCPVGRGQCVDTYGFGEPYMPILEALQELARQGDDVLPALRSQAPTWLSQMPGLLSPSEQEELRRSLASSTGERMVRELQYALEELSRERMTVLVLEDLHWSDAATVAALAALASRREPARLLVLATFRPADAVAVLHPVARLRHELLARRLVVDLALDGLDVQAVAAWLDARFAGHDFPSGLPQLLHSQTAGNALFLLNSVEDLEQRGWLLRTENRWRCTVDARRIGEQVPDSTRAMIEARLAALPPADREMLEAASIVGSTFASQAVAAVLGREAADVEAGTAALAADGHYLKALEAVRWPDGSSGAQYAFRHALYQQVLYSRVTAARRQAAHRAVAERLELGFAKSSAEVAGTLALHHERGGSWDGAVTHLMAAAQLAQSRYAYDLAIPLLRRALELLAFLPETPQRDGREIALLSSMTACVFAEAGPGAHELNEIGERLDHLTQSGANSPPLFLSLIARVAFYVARGPLHRAAEGAQRILDRTSGAEWAAEISTIARGQLGFTQMRGGRLPEAITSLQAGAQLPVGRISIIDATVGFRSDLGICFLLTGDLDRGLRTLRDADALAEAGNHPPTLVFCLPNVMRAGMFLEDRAMVEEAATRLGMLADRLASPNVAPYRDLGFGWLRVANGDVDGVDQMRRGQDALARFGYLTFQAFYASQLSSLLLGLGRPDAAQASLDEGAKWMADTGMCWCEPEILRMQGEILAAAGARDSRRTSEEAQRWFRRAIDVASAQSARWWELRAWFSLARVLPAEERAAEALPRLRTLFGELRGGDDLPPLREIRRFLET